MKKDLLVFAAEGFEDIEMIGSLDIFMRGELTFDVFSLNDAKQVKGDNAIVNTKPFSELKASEAVNNYRGLFMPGGMGHTKLLDSPAVLDIIKQFKAKGLFLTAICAAPEVLVKAGVVEKTTITAYPGFAKNGHNTGKEVEVDGKIITGRDMRATIAFADAVVKQMQSAKK